MQILSKFLLKIIKTGNIAELKKSQHSKIGKNVKFGEIHYFEINKNLKELSIDDEVKFYSQVNLTVGNNATLSIGKNTTINKYTSIVALKGIKIGENCLIGENVKIYDNNHRVDLIEGVRVPNHKEFLVDEILIGDNVWIASNVTILKGVKIGNNSIIGAGCVIHKDVPANSIFVNEQKLKEITPNT